MKIYNTKNSQFTVNTNFLLIFAGIAWHLKARESTTLELKMQRGY